MPSFRDVKEREKERKKEERRLRRPIPLSRIFVIDVSGPSVSRGIVREVCEGIRNVLYGGETNGDASGEADGGDEAIGRGETVGFISVGETVGFWSVAVSLASLCAALVV